MFAAPLIALEQGEVNVLTLHTAGGLISVNVILLDAHHCLVRPVRKAALLHVAV